MNYVKITSTSNPLIKVLRSLHDKKGRLREKAIILEGVRIVSDAVESGADIRHFIVSESFLNMNKQMIACYPENKTVILSDELFKKVGETDNPQGLLAVAEMPSYNDQQIYSELSRLIILENIQDPGNAGTIIRTADAFGFDAVIFSKNSVDPFNSKVIRSTMGSLFHLPVIVSHDIYQTIQKLKDIGIVVAAAHLRDSVNCFETDLSGNVAIIIGNEGKGITERMIELSDIRVTIPMFGNAESLNASSAASILLYESMRQLRIKRC